MKDVLGTKQTVELADPVQPERYDEAYFLGACEGYTEFIASEGAHLSRRLHQAFAVAKVVPGRSKSWGALPV